MSTNNKITDLPTLLVEKERLQNLCKQSEARLGERIDFIRHNYVELSVDNIFIPAVKKAFNMSHLLDFFNLKSVTSLVSDRPVTKNKIIDAAQELFGKTGWLLAFRLGMTMIKRFFK
jgi:hypothetical protein